MKIKQGKGVPLAPRPVSAATPPVQDGDWVRDLLREQVALRAYQLFLDRGGRDGFHEDDWYQAEHELGLGNQ